ncbi:methyltransferase domain-containing protein [Chloroflexales bacterium ZM16-3]|nr:methyltransferase domain-containing protein [Chloroflexales bacterium ZM16-3]
MPFHDHFSGHAGPYAQARPTYPDALIRFVAAAAPGRACAWDCATGSGQAAVALAAHFDLVRATDASAAQIAQATPHPRVQYAVQPAERVDFPDASVDALTVAQALHWFDIPTFFAEARRVLRPGGLFCAWGYSWSHVTPAIDVIVRTHILAMIQDAWAPQNALLWDGYRAIALPFAPVTPPPWRSRWPGAWASIWPTLRRGRRRAIRREAFKQGKWRPLREIVALAPDALTAVCPCWLGSPLSVAQFTPVERQLFDVVIFDEASQIVPEVAIAALRRGAAVVVAGDRNQLPPTPFFTSGSGGESEVPEPEDRFESLLDAASTFLPTWPLDWHYRSRDESLIGFANQEIYEGRLVTFPLHRRPALGPQPAGARYAHQDLGSAAAAQEGRLPHRDADHEHDRRGVRDAALPPRAAMNDGRVRVLLGSTGKMITGMNVQRRLIALHNLDCPWRPGDIEQRHGRILRQGNQWPQVYVFSYITEGSFDAYMWQSVESKARFIEQALAGEITARTVEDTSEVMLSAAEIKAIASGNPQVVRKVQLEAEVARLDRVRAVWLDTRRNLRIERGQVEDEIRRAERRRAQWSQAQMITAAHPHEPFSATVQTTVGSDAFQSFTVRAEAGAAGSAHTSTWSSSTPTSFSAILRSPRGWRTASARDTASSWPCVS